MRRVSHLLATALSRSRASAAASGTEAAAIACSSNSISSSAWQQVDSRHALLSTAVDATQQELQKQPQQHTCSVAARYAMLPQQRCFGSDAHSSSEGGSSFTGSGSSSGAGGADALQASMDKLVDTAVGLVEEGRLTQATQVLQQGIDLLNSTFPDRPELSELHNQAALLLLFGHQHDEAAKHAQQALEVTQRFFGAHHPLTGHRLLRLGTIRVAAGQLQEAQPLLAAAIDMLSKQREDASLSEALFYLHVLAVAASDSPQEVMAATPGLQDALKHLASALGAESMIVRLALAAHSQQVGVALDRSLGLGEAAFKQHITLQELQDPGSAELGLTLYQLATTYYSHDMLQDAGPALQRASALLRTHYPAEHDLVQLCKHRLGMVCAAGRDYRSATLLLGDTLQHYRQQQQEHALAHEAELGLAMARIKGLDPSMSKADRDAAVSEGLQQMRSALAGMATALGAEHLLVTGGSRYLAQLAVMTGHAAPQGS
ncbi:hypothetical protein COO60DRAFT_1497721 [Scenedesmus sp. NREL 46B-D3]|nr:hypothetical protein COO60DRAFT_1497721 [Scenedesmus sp. NREL 46B-D3]